MIKPLLGFSFLFMLGCSAHKPIQTAANVDLDRFMGKWYVIANIPTFIEKDAYNAVEIYQRNPDGTISTTFQFNKGDFDGELVQYHPTGRVVDTSSNAIWQMQFIWPFQADYRIVHVDSDYSITVIGRVKRDYVWLMARTPTISDELYSDMLDIIRRQDYRLEEIQRVPHQAQSDKNDPLRT